MKFVDFYTQYVGEILHEKPTYIRSGQALMNFLHQIWPEEYQRIIQGTYIGESVDCFYNDNFISVTINHLEKIWHKRDEEQKKNTIYRAS